MEKIIFGSSGFAMGQRETGRGPEANAKTLKHFWLTTRHFVELHPTLIAKKNACLTGKPANIV